MAVDIREISRESAKRAFRDGRTIFILPDKLEWKNDKVQPNAILNIQGDFSEIVWKYKHENCNETVGKDVKFFVIYR